jgi:pyruvate dehydrogenase (quinone)
LKVAEACGIRGWRVEAAQDSETIAEEALSCPGAALIEAVVDPDEPLLPPRRIEKYARNMEQALERGTPGVDRIRQALAREPQVNMLRE